jgi:hypothetical protein
MAIENSLEDINKSLVVLNSNQETISDLLREEKVRQLKEKTEVEPVDPISQRDIKLQAAQNVGIESLRQTFSDSFSNLFDFFKSPGSLLKAGGMLTGSPIFMMLGEKLDDLKAKYDENKAQLEKDIDISKETHSTEIKALEASKDETKEDELITLVKKDSETGEKILDTLNQSNLLKRREMKGEFLKEAQREEDLRIQEERNDLLRDTLKQQETQAQKEEKKNIFDLLKDPKGFIGSLLGGLAGGGIIGGIRGLAGRGIGAVGRGIGGLGRLAGKGLGALGGARGALRLFGKAAIPLTLLTGGIDFAEGFKKALEITGREGLGAQIQAGLSQAISGFTFGLVDPKTISKTIDNVREKVVSFFTEPFKIIEGIWKGEVKIADVVGQIVEKVTFGFFTKESVSSAITTMKDKIVGFFTAPFDLLKNAIDAEKPITETISEYFSAITFGLIDAEKLNTTLTDFKNTVVGLFMKPINAIKEYITGFDIFQDLSSAIAEFDIGELINIDSLKESVVNLKDKLKSLISEPFSVIKGLFADEEEIKPEDVEPEKLDLKVKEEPKVIAEKEPVPVSIQETMPSIQPIEQRNVALDVAKQMEVERRATEGEERAIPIPESKRNNIITTNNNLISPEDMSTKTDDIDFGRMALSF